MPTVSAIVLAAGLSSRMNGPNKVLMPWGGRTMVEAVVDTLKLHVGDVLVVTGRDAELVAEKVSPTIFNSEFQEGMGGSIAIGVKNTAPSHGVLVAHADMPALRAEVVVALLAEYSERAIVVPIYSDEPDRFGHPILFGQAYRDELMALRGPEGGKQILSRHSDQIIRVFVEGSLIDYDSPSDLPA